MLYICAGFFYIENHGVPQELIDRAFSSFSEYVFCGDHGRGFLCRHLSIWFSGQSSCVVQLRNMRRN